MSRIAAALLIVIAMLALNGGLLRPAFAEAATARATGASVEVSQPTIIRSGRVLGLLMALEALRQSQLQLGPQKV
jgi:hypothetical protein